MEQPSNGPFLPLVIGVTGHRKIDVQNPRLAGAVSDALTVLKEAFPSSPFLLLTGLAEGADRLVAKLAVEILSAELVVVLPFEREEFNRDFKTPASVDEFKELAGRAQSVGLCPQRESHAEVCRPGEARNRQYARAGAFIVEHAQVLIGVWDGLDARGTGGTGDVVKWWKSGEVPPEFSSQADERNVLWASHVRPFIHIHPQNAQTNSDEVFQVEGATQSALQRIELYNRDVMAHLKERGLSECEASLSHLFPAKAANEIVESDTGLFRLVRAYCCADALAREFQRKDLWLIGLVAVVFFASLLVKPLFLVVFAAVWWGRRQQIENRFFDYRALAEGLRVAIFWRMAGLKQRVSLNYLSEHVGVLSWVHESLRSAEVLAITPTMATDASRMRIVKESWLKGQLDFFTAKLAPMQARLKRLKWLGTAAFLASSCVGLLEFLAGFEPVTGMIGNEEARGRFLANAKFASEILVAVAVTIGFYAAKKAFDALSKRYRLSAQLYARAIERLDSGQYPPEKVFLQIGREALNENADWLWRQHETPLKPKR